MPAPLSRPCLPIVPVGLYCNGLLLATTAGHSRPEEAGLFLFDYNSFFLNGGSSKKLSVRVAENALAGGNQVKANLCAARYVGMETGSQSHVVIRTCALVTITS